MFSWNQAKKDDFIKKLFLPLYLKHINKLISKRNLYISITVLQNIFFYSNKYIPIFKKINHLRNDSKLQAISNPLSFSEQKNVNFQEKKAQVLIVGRFSESERNVFF